MKKKTVKKSKLSVKRWAKLGVCLVLIAYVMQMTSMFVQRAVPLVGAEEKVSKIYTFGNEQALSYLSWKGTTEAVRANPKSISNKSVSSAFDKGTMAFCLNRKWNTPPMSGAKAEYSRELNKREFSPIYYAYFSGNKYGVSGKKLWYSTQVAIWCMLGQISSVRAKGIEQTESLAHNGNEDVLKAVKQIVRDSEANLVKPFTSGKSTIRILGTPNFKLNEQKNKITITGLKTNVSECKVTVAEASDNTKVSVDGKNISIVADYVNNEKMRLELIAESKYQKYSGKVYFLDGNYQNVGFVGDTVIRDVSAKRIVKFSHAEKTGKITIKKHPCINGTTYNSALKDAVFTIKGENFESGEEIEVSTNDKGVAEVDNLPYGKYEISEIQAPEGFYLKNEKGESNHIVCEINESEPEFVYDCYNEMIQMATITIFKCDVDNRSKKLTGAKFVCRSVDGAFEAVIPEHHTEKGIYTIEVVHGKYIITEVEAPEGYLLDEENCSWEVVVGENEENPNVGILVENSLPKGGIEVLKKDARTGAVLSGAKFSLIYKGETIATKVTDESGCAVFDDLYYGDYLLVEENAPDGYLPESNNKYDVRIDKSNAMAKIEVKNEPVLQIQPTPESTAAGTSTPESTERAVLPEIVTPVPTTSSTSKVVEPDLPSEPNTPSEPYEPSAPKTGDESDVWKWSIVLLVALTTGGWLCLKAFKREINEN